MSTRAGSNNESSDSNRGDGEIGYLKSVGGEARGGSNKADNCAESSNGEVKINSDGGSGRDNETGGCNEDDRGRPELESSSDEHRLKGDGGSEDGSSDADNLKEIESDGGQDVGSKGAESNGSNYENYVDVCRDRERHADNYSDSYEGIAHRHESKGGRQ